MAACPYRRDGRCNRGCRGFQCRHREENAEPRRLPDPGASISDRAQAGLDAGWWVPSNRRAVVVIDTTDFLSLCPADSTRIEEHLEALCPSCKGSGEALVHYGAGPDDGPMQATCDTCDGVGTLPRCPWDEWKSGRDV
jgi:hypothetical protein